VREAKQCQLHSLCVLPLWMPEITQKAPVAVLEILQPETQPDFESLHELVRTFPFSSALFSDDEPCVHKVWLAFMVSVREILYRHSTQ
jgi:hypothetical protein